MKVLLVREHHKEVAATGRAPIYLRLTLGLTGGPGQRAEIATGVTATRRQWPTGNQRLRGSGAEVEAMNAQLDMWLGKAKETYLRLKDSPDLTAKLLKQALVGERRAHLPLLHLADRYYAHAAAPAARKARNTLSSYRTRLKSLDAYVREHLRAPNLEAEAVTLPWLRAFERWLSVERKYGAATVHKHVNHVQAVIGFGAHEGLLLHNPVADYDYQARPEPRDPVYLPEEEVQQMAAAVLPTRALQDVCDAWLFCCYTGLSYVEYNRFTPGQHLHSDASGQAWIRIERQKKRWFSTAKVSIPVLAETAALLARYQLVHLPKVSNAYFNRALKEVGAALQLSVPLTVGLARHTASHRLRNVYGFSDEDAAAICGHSIQMMNGHYSRKREEGLKQAMTRLLPAPVAVAEPAGEPCTLLNQLRARLGEAGAQAALRELLGRA